MSERFSPKVIPLHDLRDVQATAPDIQDYISRGEVPDSMNRVLRDLRISVTDRCNFRCNYCMPKEVFDKNYSYLPHSSLLSFEEITRLSKIAVSLGVRKIRLTGGEPLLRRNVEELIAQLAALRTPDGASLDLTLTTNGTLLAKKAQMLKAAGLRRVTVSLDALDDAIFRRMNDVDFPVASVLEGIDAAHSAGLGPIKINMVVKRGTNDQEIVRMAEHFRGSGKILRFIEFMDVGATNGWRMDDVVPSSEVIQRLNQSLPLIPLEAAQPGETAQRWGYANALGTHDSHAGEIGVISSVTQAFCGDCNRARLSTEGRLFLCLFASQGHDLRTLLRCQASDAEIAAYIANLWRVRTDRYSQLRGSKEFPQQSLRPKIEMSYIGG